MTNTNSITTILENHGLRKTPNRISILNEFSNSKHALSHADIENALKELDRVTIYRTLSSFADQGIIHKVLDESGTAKYALCQSECTEHKHEDSHVHFSCTKCKLTFCLESISIPTLQIPKGYAVKEFNLLVQGVCKNCNTKRI